MSCTSRELIFASSREIVFWCSCSGSSGTERVLFRLIDEPSFGVANPVSLNIPSLEPTDVCCANGDGNLRSSILECTIICVRRVFGETSPENDMFAAGVSTRGTDDDTTKGDGIVGAVLQLITNDYMQFGEICVSEQFNLAKPNC